MKKPELNITVSQLDNIIDEWIFSQRDRIILKLKLIDNKSQEQIAEEMDISVSQTRRILYKGYATIVAHLPREKPTEEKEQKMIQKGTENDSFVIC